MPPNQLGSTRVQPLSLESQLQARDEKLWQKEKAYANAKKLSKLPFNYNVCHGGRSWTWKMVHEHLYRFGRGPTLCNIKPSHVIIFYLFTHAYQNFNVL
jgi:hypothetical protein